MDGMPTIYGQADFNIYNLTPERTKHDLSIQPAMDRTSCSFKDILRQRGILHDTVSSQNHVF